MLTKDIKLKRMDNGEYDRVFHVNDFQTVNDLEAIENSIIIGLMTRLGELNHNITYTDFGCGAWGYLKQNHTSLAKIAIQETITRSIKKIKGIKTVEHIKIEANPINPYPMDIFFTITLDNNVRISDRIELRSI